MRSSRSWVPMLGWLAATLTSIGLASVAMQPVLRTATPDDGALVSVDQIRRSTGVVAAPAPSPVATTAPAEPPTRPTTEASRPTPKEPGKASKPATAAPTTRPPSTTPPPAGQPQSRVVDGWTVTTGGDGVDTYIRSFRVSGGQAVLRIRDTRVEVVSATPSDGFEVAIVQNEPINLAVYFNEPNHSFIVHAGWNVDRPFAQVSEVGG